MGTGAWAQTSKKIAVVARRVRAALERNQWNQVGRLVREEWEFRAGICERFPRR